jgi:N12 class adenine-specific DNA methylase
MISDLLGLDEDDAREALAGLVFTDPDTKTLVHAPEYLSGDVRTKLDQARANREGEPEFEVNVHALEAVMPPTLGADEITAKLGAVWISAEVHQAFLNELLRTRGREGGEPAAGHVGGPGRTRQGPAGHQRVGHSPSSRPDIAQAVMEQRPCWSTTSSRTSTAASAGS